ncbi:MAG TPA: class I SAM-dependent methyltransferase [Thermoplasmata archaeon]|nr:class I SAM-dependent methyltransferase [Thermoplasmata archaeon]
MPRRRSPPTRPGGTDAAHRADLRRNRRSWERESASYDRRHAAALDAAGARAWGFWRIPESALGLLGRVDGLDVLEYGCGAARWSRALARRGAQVTGIDLSREQLTRARAVIGGRGRRPALIRGNAERTPFRDSAFDLVFCDWGAMTFAEPYRTIPECSRLLRVGGRLVFAGASPFRYVTFDRRTDRQVRRLTHPYFGLYRIEFPDSVEYTLPYGEWVRLFRTHGLVIEALYESRPRAGATTHYLSRSDSRYARDWPLEAIWSLRKSSGGQPA